jgi:uncharacterized membrane protein YphA (DoxX/SURF4 family)
MNDTAAWILLLGRILFVLFWLNSAIWHVRQGQMATGYAASSRFPLPRLAAWPSGVWLVAGSLSIVLGAWADLGALMLALFAILAAAWFHRFWEIDDPQQRQAQRGNFWRNATFVGGCLIIFAFFTTFGHDLPLTMTDPLFDLR